MKKIIVLVLVFAMIPLFVWAKGGSTRERVPKVRYIEPRSEGVVDLRGKDSLTFRWKSGPKPAGGRQAFRFNIWKGRAYDLLMRRDLDSKVYSIEVPSELFEDGQIYTWQVKQRDMAGHAWSMDYRWDFRVKK